MLSNVLSILQHWCAVENAEHHNRIFGGFNMFATYMAHAIVNFFYMVFRMVVIVVVHTARTNQASVVFCQWDVFYCCCCWNVAGWQALLITVF